jgi:hypothetical protein
MNHLARFAENVGGYRLVPPAWTAPRTDRTERVVDRLTDLPHGRIEWEKAFMTVMRL